MKASNTVNNLDTLQLISVILCAAVFVILCTYRFNWAYIHQLDYNNVPQMAEYAKMVETLGRAVCYTLFATFAIISGLQIAKNYVKRQTSK